jgi:DNA-binding CsgD family transcriptional regulator
VAVATVPDVVGRDEELATLVSFLDRAEHERGVMLLIEGEAGIGKTTLWREGVRAARDHGFAVLEATGVHAEAQLAFAALGDLLDGVLAEVLAQLPEPRRHALAVALLLEPPGKQPPEPGAVALAFLDALRMLARTRPVVVAIDDVQWLDVASTASLEFVARRLRDDNVSLLLACRRENGRAALSLNEARLVRVGVGPLSFGALHRLIRTNVDVFPRAVLRKIVDASGGNPFFALELARALHRREARPRPGEPFSVPTALGELMDERLAVQPTAVQEVLEVASAVARPTVDVLDAVLGVPSEDLVAEAVHAGIVDFVDGELRFAHPLLASAAYARLAPRRRRLLHRRLAELAREPEERARHLALGADAPDEDVAAALEAAAERARARGAVFAATDLLDEARRLTPPDRSEDLLRRTVAAASGHDELGNSDAVRSLVGEVLKSAPRGTARSHALILACTLRFDEGYAAGAEAAEQALAETDDIAQRCCIEGDLVLAHYMLGNLAEAEAHAHAQLELAEQLHEPAALADALAAAAMLECFRGRSVRPQLLERVEALLEAAEPSVAEDHFYVSRSTLRLFHVLEMTDRPDAARARLGMWWRDGLEHEREKDLAPAAYYLGYVDCWAGRWTSAARYARECEERATEIGRLSLRQGWLYLDAFVDARQGRLDAARAAAEEGRRLAEQGSEQRRLLLHLGLLGFIELAAGDAAAAERYLGEAEGIWGANGFGDPCVARFHADWIEALIELGEVDEAESHLAWLEGFGRTQDRPWALATGARCRGLLLATRGDLDAAVATLERALFEHERLPQPFERGRTLFALGQVRRRARQRRAARETLNQALEVFEELGALLWTEKARAELARIGGRRTSSGDLTPSERRIAELVAEGKTNKEVAAILVVTDRTVESALTQIYRKLDVRSRTELTRKLAAPG